MARCIGRPAARRARMIMAMRAACKRVAAHQARGYEMPLKRHFRDSSNFWPTAGSASTTSGRKRPSLYLSRFCPKGETPKCTCLFSCTRLHAERRSATKTPVRASSVRAEARRLVGRSFGCGHYQKGATRGRAFGALRHHLLPLSKLQVAPKGAESYCDDFAVRRSSRPFAERQKRTAYLRYAYQCALWEMDDCGTWYHGGRTYEFLETRAACGKCCDVKKRGLAGFANPSRIEFFC